MTDLINQAAILELPRGDLNKGSLQLDMSIIYAAESRIAEIRTINPATIADLIATFNEATNVTTKYVSWIKFEILRAKRNYDLAKATVILDKLPAEIARLKESGLKDNADFRSALYARDSECRQTKDIMDALEAAKAFLDAKIKSFERSYWDSKEGVKNLTSAAAPNLSVNPGPDSFNVSYSANNAPTSPSAPSAPVGGSFIGVSKF